MQLYVSLAQRGAEAELSRTPTPLTQVVRQHLKLLLQDEMPHLDLLHSPWVMRPAQVLSSVGAKGRWGIAMQSSWCEEQPPVVSNRSAPAPHTPPDAPREMRCQPGGQARPHCDPVLPVS